MGIALATAVSAWINAIFLYVILKIRKNIALDSRLISKGYKIIICSVVMGVVCYFSNLTLFSHMTVYSTILNIGVLTLAVVINQIILYSHDFFIKSSNN